MHPQRYRKKLNCYWFTHKNEEKVKKSSAIQNNTVTLSYEANSFCHIRPYDVYLCVCTSGSEWYNDGFLWPFVHGRNENGGRAQCLSPLIVILPILFIFITVVGLFAWLCWLLVKWIRKRKTWSLFPLPSSPNNY